MLKIEYSPHSHTALISASTKIKELQWADIRRIFEENSPEIEEQGARTIVVPWWCLLLVRRDLSYVLTKYSIRPDIAPDAVRLLEQAKEREAAYKVPGGLLEVEPDSVQPLLDKLGFNRALTLEQARNVSRLVGLPAGASFSVPGAGKTTEALAYYLLCRQVDTRLLVVAPKNAFAVWEEQVSMCLPDLTGQVVRLQGGEEGVNAALDANPAISLISYQQLSRVLPRVSAFLLENVAFMFVDESHRMKRGHAGVHGSAILRLSHLPLRKLLLSGTPIPNAISDLVPQFTFLYPEIRVSDADVAEKIRGVYVRTTKAELGLKDTIRVLQRVPMTNAQLRLYRALRSEAVRQLELISLRDRAQLRSFGKSIVRLMQVATDPALLSESSIANMSVLREAIAEGPSAKVMEACRIARELTRQGHKCIIWSQFVQIVEYVASMLADLGAEFIHGGVETDEDEENTESRESRIKRFHEDESVKVLVANPAACAESISLHHVCHHAIYIDRNYNAAHYLQSEDRIHRLGLKPDQNTYITILSAPGTIDESIQRRLELKVDMMRTVLNDPSLTIEPIQFDEEIELDRGDIEDLRRALCEET